MNFTNNRYEKMMKQRPSPWPRLSRKRPGAPGAPGAPTGAASAVWLVTGSF